MKRWIVGLAAVLVPVGGLHANASINIALNKPATADATYYSSTADKAVDGDLLTVWNAGSYGTPSNPHWLQVDLEGVYTPDRIVLITGDTDRFTAEFYVDYVLEYSTDNAAWNLIQTGTLYDDPTDFPGDEIDYVDDITLSGNDAMRYVRYTVPGGTHWAALCELQVFTSGESPPAVIPEPSTFAIWSLLGTFAVTVGWWRRRRTGC